MAKGNPGGNPSNLTHISYSSEEMDTIDKLSRYRESFSYEDIAQVLNQNFAEHNKGTRSGKGIQKYLTDPNRKEKRAEALRSQLAGTA
jgi:hypothetical protein